jgi:hypothetical protein
MSRKILSRIPKLFVNEAAQQELLQPGLATVVYQAKDSDSAAGVIAGQFYWINSANGSHNLLSTGSTTSFSTNTITEATAGSGVTIDGVLIKDGTITTTAPMINSVDPAITALGSADTDGYALTKQVNIITGGAANTGVELPSAVVGQVITVVNLTTTAKKVYATTGDAIDDKTATTGFVTLLPEDVVTFYCYTVALWQSDFEAEAAYVSLSTDTISEFTAAAGITADSVLLKDGGVSNSAATAFAGFYFSAAQNNIAANAGGAISVANYLTTINTDGDDDAYTLANGTQIGQMKKILLVVDGGGNGVVTPATAFAGGTAATFGDAGDYLILMWTGALWAVIENSGVTIA